MATHLQQLLRSLCQNNEWSYAVFWKLKHRARMVLTWEDAYYNNHSKHDPSESKSFGDAPEILHDGHFAHDPLGLAVAKMSYHVYSLGEGIVGQVAVTGKHRWIFAGDRHLMNSCPSPELCDGWQAQFSAGIKTIVVAAVVPHGVVQLGSLSKVDEDPKLLTHIRDIFSTLQDPSACHIQNLMRYNMQSASLLKQSDDVYGTSLPGIHLSEAMESMGKIALPEAIDNVKLIQSISLNQQSTDVFGDAKCRSNNYRIQNADSFESGACNTVVFDGDTHSAEGKLSKLVSSDALERQTFEVNADMQPKFNCVEALENINPSMFSAGSELYEALGPAFLKQCYTSSWNIEKSEDRSTSHIPEIMESSMLTSDSGSDHLLEAVVASFCHNDANVKKTVSFSTSESMLTSEKMPEPSINTSHTIGSSCYSISCSSLLEESTQNCLNSSDSCSIRSSTSTCRDPLARPIEPGKPNKKRARPGENSRPRPRDRQLIQDRIKELRELVPNGSKCSIDSLLERTIKHMVFLQSVTKHADKLSNCSKSRGCGNETGVLGSGYEQGSSWAVEVGGHMKICPIVVENLNMNGQMLIEMLCEECDHFLEIAEAIRSLGLTILKGATDNHGDKTWMRFVVEGQNNRNLHRMDVLWSLVQILQSKTTV